MNLRKYTERLTELQQQSNDYSTNKAPLGKEVQNDLEARLNKIDELLSSDSLFMLDVATQETPLSELIELMNERETLKAIQSRYHFRTIAERGINRLAQKIESLQSEYRSYFTEHLDDDNAAELIPTMPRKFKAELENLLEQHQVKKAREAKTKTVVDAFMADLNKLLAQPHIRQYDLSSMQKRARSINAECVAAAGKLNQLPLLA